MNALKPTPGFEPRRPFGSFVSVTRDVLLSPAGFFRDLGREGSYAGPVVYAVVCQVVAVVLAALYDLSRFVVPGDLGEISVLGIEGAAGALLWTLWLLFFAPIVALFTLFVGAGVYQLLVMLLVGRRNAGYGATLRVTGYLSAIGLLLWLPALGLAAGLWGVWINTLGMREFHSTTTARALVVAAVPYVLALAWVLYGVATGSTTLWEFLVGGGTNFPTRDNPLIPGG